MYPNPYGGQQPGQNIGFNPNYGQQQEGMPYPGQNHDGLPYPVQPQQTGSPGTYQAAASYPAGPGMPQLPGSGQGYAPARHYAPGPGFPSNLPGSYGQSSATYPQQSQHPYGTADSQMHGAGYAPIQPSSYPQAAAQPTGYPPVTSQSTGYPPVSTGYPTPHHYAPSQAGYPPSTTHQGAYATPATAHPPYSQGYPTHHEGHSFASSAPPHAHSAYPTQPFTSSHAASYGTSSPSMSGPVALLSYTEKPTVVAALHFDPLADSQTLRKAMKGFGTDEAAILNVICKRTNSQRLKIAQAFKTSYGKDLIKDLKSELGGRFEDVIVALMTPHYDYMAITLQRAIGGIGTKERLLVDILCTATNEEIRQISAAYSRIFGRSLERDLAGDTSGYFRRLLVSMAAAGRLENQPADRAMASADAKALYNAGTNRLGTDEATFNQILCLRSFPHLRLVFQEYEQAFGRPIQRVIEDEFSGDVEIGLKAVVLSVQNRPAYFAGRIHDSFVGMGTKDDELIFVMVTRSEIDLQNIKEEYQRNYNKSFASAIAAETSGDYKKALIALLRE